MDIEERPTKNIRPAAVGSEQIQSVATTPRQTRAMTRQELPCTSAANNKLASTNRKRTHQDPDEHDLSQSRQTHRLKAMLQKLDDWKICTSSQGQLDDVNFFFFFFFWVGVVARSSARA